MKVEVKVLGGSRTGMVIPITIPQFMIGRAEDCHLKPRSELISRYHCAILSEASYVAVRDLGSKNGVYVNGERIAVEQELKNGDRLAIGPLEFEVVLAADTPNAQEIEAQAAQAAADAKAAAEAKAAQEAQEKAIADAQAAAKAAQAAAQAKAAAEALAAAQAQAAEAARVAAEAQAAAQAQLAKAAADAKAAQEAKAAADAKAAEDAKAAAAKAAAAAAAAKPKPQPTVPENLDVSNEDDLSDWLLGDDEDGVADETQTLQTALDDLDLPYTPQEPKAEEPQEKKPTQQMPNSSDAAANLLKNFFKGGR